jgi:restriction endonuclease Mrr
MGDWEFAILSCVNDLGTEVMLQQIYRRIGNYITLTENHLRPTVYGGRPAYQHEVRGYISNLYEKGRLQRLDRGVYSITEKGRKFIEKSTQERYLNDVPELD